MADITKQPKKPSNRLMGMKFMQRSVEKEQQEKMEKERKRIITEAEWKIDYESTEVQKPKIRVEYQPSYLSFTETTQTGRQSYQKFNKSIENPNEESEQRLKREMEKEKEGTMTDEELVKQMRRTNKSKRTKDDDLQGKDEKRKKTKINNNTKGTGFIKPE
ncbi:uncharacterized protein BX664DRAFT_341503 [Halteromyces radiatus]|uniref:uncharacterized protein n=1 Tax=Halteromyces radiatus TaxID=101107 RepID=UPI00221F8DE9|nr:uncharacterized protein BX664DRAFT_341503 [Halteromyces radiatus]KAI8079807.1 hypothetical protein BX664DRAFT_341503 [Halteromyces radiatus]